MSERARIRLLRAEAEAATARAQLGATLERIHDELSPASLANRAIAELRERSQSIADNAVSTLISRPVITALLASLLGALLRNRATLRGILSFFLGRSVSRRTTSHSD